MRGELPQPLAPVLGRDEPRPLEVALAMARLDTLELAIELAERGCQSGREQGEALARACLDERRHEQQIELAAVGHGRQEIS